MENNFDRDFRAIVAAIVSGQVGYGVETLDGDKIIQAALNVAGGMQKMREKVRLAEAQRNQQYNEAPYSGISGLNQSNNIHNPFGY